MISTSLILGTLFSVQIFTGNFLGNPFSVIVKVLGTPVTWVHTHRRREGVAVD